MSESELPTGMTDAALDQAVELLERLCAAGSCSGDLGGLERTARIVADELAARGLAAEVAPVSVGSMGSMGSAAATDADALRPLIVARSPATGRKPLLLLGHFDTVLDATAPRRENGRLLATGAIDMKGGIATLLGALDRLAAAGETLPRDLVVVLVPDEEVAGEISKRATAEFGAAARACFVLEPGELRAGDAETLVVGRRGLANFRLELFGRAAHSGLAFHQGRSAVAAAGAWIAGAAALAGSAGGPTVNLARVLGGERELVESPHRAAELFGSDRLLNVVPDRALVEGELRFLDPADGIAVRARLESLARELAASTGVRFELAFGETIDPVAPTAERLALAARAVELAARRGWQLEVERDRGGISFPNFLPAGLALPVLDGLGPAGGGMHTRDEFVDLRSFARRIVLLADLLREDAAAV